MCDNTNARVWTAEQDSHLGADHVQRHRGQTQQPPGPAHPGQAGRGRQVDVRGVHGGREERGQGVPGPRAGQVPHGGLPGLQRPRVGHITCGRRTCRGIWSRNLSGKYLLLFPFVYNRSHYSLASFYSLMTNDKYHLTDQHIGGLSVCS